MGMELYAFPFDYAHRARTLRQYEADFWPWWPDFSAVYVRKLWHRREGQGIVQRKPLYACPTKNEFTNLYCFQADQLYVYDPAALQNIVVKQQDVYEETEYFHALVAPNLQRLQDSRFV